MSETEESNRADRFYHHENLASAALGTESIDPEGRASNGDMGWLRVGTGMPEIEEAIAGLPDKQVSEVIHTPKGYHLVEILERKPGDQLPFEAVEDRVRQQMVAEHLPGYLQGLQKRYQVAWRLLDTNSSPVPAVGSP